MGQIVVPPVREKLRRKQHYALWFRPNGNRCVLRNYVIWGFGPIYFCIGTRGGLLLLNSFNGLDLSVFT